MIGEVDLLDALEAHSGLVCFVGAGGKKTILYRLGAAHPGRVGITATLALKDANLVEKWTPKNAGMYPAEFKDPDGLLSFNITP